MSRTWTARARAATGVTAALATVATLTGAGSAVAAPAGDTWVDGDWVQDTIISCITGNPAPGYTGRASFLADAGRVPQVGETFYVRVEVGLPGLPCTNSPTVLPEIILPAGMRYADDARHPVRWAISELNGDGANFSTRRLVYDRGVNGGVLIGLKSADYPRGGPIEVRQSQSLEIRIPVRAKRTMKGPATPQPMCDDRLQGDGPCPVAESGDHLQVAVTKRDTGSMRYIVPFVGIFVQKAKPVLRTAFTVSAQRRGRAAVRIGASTVPTGRVSVTKGRRTLAKDVLTRSDRGRLVLRLPRLSKGSHRLVVRYGGSRTVAAKSRVYSVRAR